ncbi:MAG TPA: hypothetical protein VMT35_02320 [Ignavibacteriaceae bacterium]|nr:hypothetical protein [Ignavibacteriaceae bacterium]
MFDNVVLQVMIGLSFIYVLYSLFTTIINEMIASLFSLRARTLGKALKRMLTDSEQTPLEQKLLNDFLKHPLLKYMSSGVFHKRPSYMSSESFSKILVDVLKGIDSFDLDESIKNINGKLDELGKKPGAPKWESDTAQLINSFLKEAGGNIEKFKTNLEKWFNDMMERTSGWYKRQVQVIILIIGLILSLAFNVNTIKIIDKLSNDKAAREQIVNISENYVKGRLPSTDSTTAKRLDLLVSRADSLYQADIEPVNELFGLGWKSWGDFTGRFWENIIGCLITALAISLGAPFWFDLLNKFVSLRGTGKKPDQDTKKVEVEKKVDVS